MSIIKEYHDVVATEALAASLRALVETLNLLETRNVRARDKRGDIVGVEALANLIAIDRTSGKEGENDGDSKNEKLTALNTNRQTAPRDSPSEGG